MPPQEPPRTCLNCANTSTPLWRRSPLGPKTLCNACGVRMKKGRLLFSESKPHFRTVESAAALAKRLRREQAARAKSAKSDMNLPRLPPLPPSSQEAQPSAHATARSAIAKSSARRKVKAFSGSAAGLYSLLAAIEFIETP